MRLTNVIGFGWTNLKFLLATLLFSFTLGLQSQEIPVTINVITSDNDVLESDFYQKLKVEIADVVGRAYTIEFNEMGKPVTNNKTYGKEVNELNLYVGSPFEYFENKVPNKGLPTIVTSYEYAEINEAYFGTRILNNTHIVQSSHSLKSDLAAFKEVYDYKNLAVITDNSPTNRDLMNRVLTESLSNDGVKFRFIDKSDINGLKNSDVDAVLIANAMIFTNSTDPTINILASQDLPTFSSFSYEDVQEGILSTLQKENSSDRFIRRIALNIERLLNGVPIEELPSKVELDETLSINYGTAKRIGIPLNYGMLASIDFLENKNVKESSNSLSLKDLMSKTVERNLVLGATSKNIDLAQQDVKLANSTFLPNVEAFANANYIDPELATVSSGTQPEFSTNTGLSVDQLIWSEEARANISIQKSVQDLEQANYTAVELDQLLNISTAYFNALVLKTNADIQYQNLLLTKNNLQIAKDNFSEGASGKADILRFESQLAQNTQMVIEAGNGLRQGYNQIKQLVNIKMDSVIEVRDAKIDQGVFENYNYKDLKELLNNPKLRPALIAFLTEEAIANSPEIKGVQSNMAIASRGYDLNDWGRFIPTVALRGQYNLGLTQSGAGSSFPLNVPQPPDGTYSVGVNLSLPLFARNQRNINRTSFDIQLEQLDLQKQNIDLSISQNINNIVLDLINEIANIEISQISETAAFESLELTQAEYNEGEVPIIQLIDAQNNYLQAQLASTTAVYNYLLRSMQLERIIGYFFLANSEEANQDFLLRARQFILENKE